jgi:hypothetical protein
MSEISQNSSVANRIVFLHIPKSAGTTLRVHLEGNFPEEQICPARFNTLHEYDADEIEKYRFFSGHFCAGGVSLIPEPKSVVTMLRDPKARVLSLYYFWKSHREEFIEKHDLNGPRLAKNLGLLEFLRIRGTPAVRSIDNSSTRALVGQKAFKKLIDAGTPRPEIAATAIDYLEGLTEFGIVEHMEASIALICWRLGLPNLKQLPRLNTGDNYRTNPNFELIEREDITPEIDTELSRLTDLDEQVYRHALSVFRERHLSYCENAEGDWKRKSDNLSAELQQKTEELSHAEMYPWKYFGTALRMRLKSRK